MATANLSQYDHLPDGKGKSFAIVVSDWNSQVTYAMLDGAVSCLEEAGVSRDKIYIYHVSGSFELVYAAAKLINGNAALDAVIVLGSVIRGGTPHFDYVCQGVTQGISSLNAQGKIPVIFGLLTTDNLEQALDRCGGKYGNKGIEGAKTALEMAVTSAKIEQDFR